MRDENVVSQDEKNKQNKHLLIVIVIVVLVLLLMYWVMDHGTSNQSIDTKKMESVPFANPTEHLDAESLWLERAQNQLKEMRENTNELKQTVSKIQADSQKSIESDPKYQALQQQIQTLQKVLSEQIEKNTNNPVIDSKNNRGRVTSTENSPPAQFLESTGIDNDVINLKPKAGIDLPIKNPDSFVPAGTFAEAIMLGAADVSAGVNSQSKPVPMLFRLIADGTLPNHKKSHLKNCVAIGAVTGDISSERGEIRIERLSCAFQNGEVVEQVVEGTIFGMDAKNGVRGNPVWREGALLGRAAFAGCLSGFANGVSQSYITNSISPLGTTQTVDNGAIFKNGLASGAANAMEKLADYNIKRAEQYHPVIQISAGQPVDVVFLKGFYLDGKKHDDIDQENHAPPELFSNSAQINAPPNTGLTLTENQLAKIKQHESDYVGREKS